MSIFFEEREEERGYEMSVLLFERFRGQRAVGLLGRLGLVSEGWRGQTCGRREEGY